MKKVNVIRLNKDLPLPEYKTAGASGMDLYASVEESIIIKPGDFKLIKTGIVVSIPNIDDDVIKMEAQVRPRSGMALKYGITVLNTPGTIDEDYRGEIGVILINHSGVDFPVNPKDRIAQLVFVPILKIQWNEVESLDDTERGDGAYGHTGK